LINETKFTIIIIFLTICSALFSISAQTGFNLSTTINLKENPDQLKMFADTKTLDEEKIKYYTKLLGLETLFEEDSMFWDMYRDSFELVSKYYYDDLYCVELPYSITLQVNVSTYVKNSQFMTIKIPLDIERNRILKSGYNKFLYLFKPSTYRLNRNKVRDE
jgi:hypothetical protein